MPSRYRPLADYLAGVPAGTEAVTLPFAEVERIVHRPLPASAWLPDWWSHRRQAVVWRSAGWCLRSVGRAEGQPAVTFARASDSTGEPVAPRRRPAPRSGRERRRVGGRIVDG